MSIIIRQTITGTATVENFPTGREVVIQTDADLQLEFWNPSAGEFADPLSVSAPQAVMVCPSAKVRITTATSANVNVVLSTAVNADTVKTVSQVLTEDEKTIARGNIGMTAAGSALATAASVAAQRTLLYLSLNSINVLYHGADSTGATDSTSAIHAAIAAAQASGGPASVYFPAGTYKCNLDITGHCKLIGDGVTNMGDWVGSDTGKTVLVPNSNASPVIKFTTIRASAVRGFEVRGNGAGTSVTGIEINSPGGFRMDDVIVRRFTTGLKSNRGCNFSAVQCGVFECNKNVWLNDKSGSTVYSHSYYFAMCSFGGAPGSGNGRCFEFDGAPFVNLHTCEIGNCYDVLKANDNGATINFIGSNFETFSTTGALIEVGNCAVNFIGQRFGMGNAVIVRSDSTATVTNTGCRNIGVNNKLCQHTGTATVISAQAMPVEEYTDNTYATLVGASTTEKIVVSARRTSDQAVSSATQTVIIYNTEENDPQSKYDNTTGIFKPEKRGMYSISASARLSAIGGSDVQMRFLRNGSEIATPVRVTTGSAATTICGSAVIYLDANDELSVAIYAAGSLTVQAGSNYATTLSIFEI